MTLASPSRTSGRVIPPSVYPVVPRPRTRLGLHPPAAMADDPDEPPEPMDERLDESPVEDMAKLRWWRRRRQQRAARGVIN